MAKMNKINFLSDVTAPNAVTYEMLEALSTVLPNVLVVPYGTTLARDYAGREVDLVILPHGTNKIANEAFKGSSLRKIVIPEGVTGIGDKAFYECRELASLNIPSSLTSIGLDAFNNSQQVVVYITDLTKWCNIDFRNAGANPLYSGGSLIGPGITSNAVFGTCHMTLPAGTTTVKPYAFWDFTGLTSAEIPSSVTSIGLNAFGRCNNLKSITLPFIGTNKDPQAGDYTSFSSIFTGNDNAMDLNSTALSSVKITGGESVAAEAFKGCSNLTVIEIPDSVTRIGDDAFYGCSSLTSITLPFVGAFKDGTTNTHFGYVFGASAYFSNSSYVPTSLKTVVITGGTSIGDDAFHYCSGLTSIVIPDSVTSIGYGAFRNCDSLVTLTLPFVGNEKIGTVNTHFGYIFGADYHTDNANYVKVNHVKITGGTNIADNAFNGCNRVQSVELPNSITSIGKAAFAGCSSLTKIAVPFVGNTKTGTTNTHFGYIFGANSHTGQNSNIPRTLSDINITGGTNIADRAFYGCYCAEAENASGDYVPASGIKKVFIANSIASIGNEAFMGCHLLSGVSFPNSNGTLKQIGQGAFCDCSALEFITLPEGLTKIDVDAFEGCKALSRITIPGSVTYIGSNAFAACTELTQFDFSGTKAQFNSLTPNTFLPKSQTVEVQCSDGTLRFNQD